MKLGRTILSIVNDDCRSSGAMQPACALAAAGSVAFAPAGVAVAGRRAFLGVSEVEGMPVLGNVVWWRGVLPVTSRTLAVLSRRAGAVLLCMACWSGIDGASLLLAYSAAEYAALVLEGLVLVFMAASAGGYALALLVESVAASVGVALVPLLVSLFVRWAPSVCSGSSPGGRGRNMSKSPSLRTEMRAPLCAGTRRFTGTCAVCREYQLSFGAFVSALGVRDGCWRSSGTPACTHVCHHVSAVP